MKIGLTGGSGVGKSTVCAILNNYGATIIDADMVARFVVEPGMPALSELVHEFGKKILLENGELARRRLADIVFSDEDALKRLNEITHPHIIAAVEKRAKNGVGFVVIDAVGLVESGLSMLCEAVIAVVADYDVRLARIQKRDNISAESAALRINAQKSCEEFAKSADFVIKNNGDGKELQNQIDYIFNLIVKGRASEGKEEQE